jgi:hypothetical protein
MRRRLSALSVAAGFIVLTWLAQGLSPATGLESGWMLGLNLANQTGLEHGTEVMFTYGPLGWVARPRAFEVDTVLGYVANTSAIIGGLAFILLCTRAIHQRWWVPAVTFVGSAVELHVAPCCVRRAAKPTIHRVSVEA